MRVRPSTVTPQQREVTSSIRPLLSSKRRPHFKTRKYMQRTKILSWVPTGPDTKYDCAGEDQQQFTGLDWSKFSDTFPIQNGLKQGDAL
jgi:hypothetical protein